ncbi:GMC family oxidoreductase N-terminal domain-containing protein [Rhodococcus pyridinivorans]|uniref:GMC family oxidoreductase N-terminal domain-containing protein n=1 Tax=Rhodococcus pyridinivorans TaxID=103816 RepID=UPI002225D662|nr:GMC family oxidoreductase N-terminal domain-containing protein [Rhodococcus pyridinivorans]MCW3472702.1 GMC family oxidoreductase N-terminal domain-containing protein [Rhodococcus pyridinivorans]
MDYDYIVVGAGSGGCAVAGRLARDKDISVLLVEAGGSDRGLTVQAPIAFAKQFHGKGDWNYYSEAEPGLNGRSVYLPRGKVIGGSSSMNAMLWVLGAREDFDGWDVPGGAWEDCAPVFRRMEDHFLGGPHGVGGPVHVRVSSNPDPVTRLFVESAKRVIGNDNTDIGGPDLEGCEPSPVTVDGGR